MIRKNKAIEKRRISKQNSVDRNKAKKKKNDEEKTSSKREDRN